MENIKQYHDFINEAKKVQEKEGISPAIYKDLEKYFSEANSPSMKGAQAYLLKNKKGWKLSQEDFDEAKKIFLK